MTSTGNRCPRCGRPIADTAYVCGQCASTLADALHYAAALWPALEATIARQISVSESPSTGPADLAPMARESRLPFDYAASEIGWVARNTLDVWVRVVQAESPIPRRDLSPVGALAYLAGHAEWLAHHRYAEGAYDELIRIPTLVERGIAQPRQTWYAGRCDNCDHDLYAEIASAFVQCSTCRATYDVPKRRENLLKLVEDQLGRPSELARALAGFGVDITRHRIATWEARGFIVRHGTDPKGNPLYRVGDILDQLARRA